MGTNLDGSDDDAIAFDSDDLDALPDFYGGPVGHHVDAFESKLGGAAGSERRQRLANLIQQVEVGRQGGDRNSLRYDPTRGTGAAKKFEIAETTDADDGQRDQESPGATGRAEGTKTKEYGQEKRDQSEFGRNETREIYLRHKQKGTGKEESDDHLHGAQHTEFGRGEKWKFSGGIP